jgi:hypothetical protein
MRKISVRTTTKTIFLAALALPMPTVVYAVCASPAAPEGRMIYNADFKTMQFCDGTNWVAMNAGVGTPVGTVPSGAVMAFNLASCPAGWSEYTLARGRFIRGIDSTGTVDPDGVRVLGSTQEDTVIDHTHRGVSDYSQFYSGGSNTPTVASSGTRHPYFGTSVANVDHVKVVNLSNVLIGGAETRPKNIALLYCERD